MFQTVKTIDFAIGIATICIAVIVTAMWYGILTRPARAVIGADPGIVYEVHFYCGAREVTEEQFAACHAHADER